MWKSLIAPAVVVSLCWMVVGGSTSYYLSWLDRATDRVLAENVASIRASNEMEATVWRMQSSALEAARERSRVSEEVLTELEADFQRSLSEAESAAKVSEEFSLVRDIRQSFEDYSTKWRRTSTDMVANETTLAELLPLVPNITKPCEQLMRLNEQLMKDASLRRHELTSWAVFGRAAMLIFGPGLGLLVRLLGTETVLRAATPRPEAAGHLHHRPRHDRHRHRGAIADSLLESELFGHEKGAFTGADRRRIGKFEQCHGGTLFLDEAGDMPQATQVKLRCVLQEGSFERIGGNETVRVDVRVIAATNQNLDALIEQGRFRRDLYYRLKGVTIHLPPLRERSEDISELSHCFLLRRNHQLSTSVRSISPDALDLLQRYSWPGNVRELQSVLRESLIASAGSVLLPQFLPPELHAAPVGDSEPIPLPEVHADDWARLGQFAEAALANRKSDLYRRAIEQFDRELVVRALSQVGGHQAHAATLLGLSRPTLRAKLRALGMTMEKVVATESKPAPGGR